MRVPMRALPFVLALSLAVVVSACGGGAAAPTAAPAAPTKAPAAAPTTAPAAPAATTAPAAAAPTKAAAPAAAAPAPWTKEVKMSMSTGGTSGTYYPYGGAIAGVWSKNIKGVTVTAETTGASVENMRLLASKQAELAMTQNDIADYAFNATEMFKEKITNFKALAMLYPEYCEFVVPASSDIKSIADLKGKRVSVGPAGSGTEANTRQILSAAGIEYKDLAKAATLSNAEAGDSFKNKQIDAMQITGGVPFPTFQDIATTQELRVLSVEGDLLQKLQAKYKALVPVTVPANTYKGQTAAVNTVAVQSMLVVRDDIDKDLVYWLTRTLIEKQPDLAQAHSKGKELSKESAVKGLTIPLHPGADQYFKEIGVIK